MDTMQLQASLLHTAADGTVITLFVGRQGGRLGLLQAGSWETLLPFRFDRIRALPDGTLAAGRGGRERFYRLQTRGGALRAVPAAMEGSEALAG